MNEQQTALEKIYRTESRRVLATLIRLLGDFELAEEALHDAFTAALVQWPKEGIPDNPRAWLVSTGRFKAIDHIRRRARFDRSQDDIAQRLYADQNEPFEDDDRIGDDRLRLIFTCCHPSLAPEAQVALTLREVCDLTTEEIASAFLTSTTTLAQRIVRAKAKIRSARIPYEVPTPVDLPERLNSVLRVVYLVFNEGYSASAGESVTRKYLADEAIRLGRLLRELIPEPEVLGLLALMLLHDSRRAARVDEAGDLVRLDEQDRSLWNRAQIEEGCALVREALSSGAVGPYSLQAAIAALHAEPATPEQTDWAEIVGLYNVLLRISPSPVVELNRAVAVSKAGDVESGLRLLDALLARGELEQYHLAHAARADFYRQLGRKAEARVAYQHALTLTRLEPERRFLERRLSELE
ncbi:RNA polymerase sigma factor [Marinimicrobium sp. ABcell2]|uniref:RNA polymerase sigma factor n=1 Tax=Marinimicrobium sp. ABcell2 TaxID=3069751 RepID=UPI0027B702A1|nr:RNA polymerase sigma factor [Marinimicrobium sp. ABcell2]MDQ2076702.1 RNA polymerase sigma factor [Marinimicrobium sp. ABcell2]